MVPGYTDMQRMAMLLLAERPPHDGQALVLGAGSGVELKAFAEGQPGWTLVGVDPSAATLDLGRLTFGSLTERVYLHEGLIDSAPKRLFSGAT